MIKLLPFIIIPVILVLGLGLWRMSVSKTSPASIETEQSSTSSSSSAPVEVPKSLPQAPTDEKVKTLEAAVDTLTKELNTLKTTNSSLDAKVKSLETVDVDMASRVTTLEKATPAPASSTSKSTVFIPLGSGGYWGNQDWYTLSDYQVNLDPANFPGYTGMVLEITMKLEEAAGTGSVRLYNTTDSSALSSEASTTSSNYSIVSSSSFKLPSGNKNYALQTKSTQGKNLFIQSARIRVNF